MFIIKRLRLEIKSTDESLYGFDIPFQRGLNIIAGQNSKGKSTIGSSIYYALGMEELLGSGAKNESALGKALKTSFDFFPVDGSEEISKKITLSKVFLEIENDRNETVTIKRYIIQEKKTIKVTT
ncbi:AAA family ATPase [Sphingobacterium sp. KU25419]|nr:AAA family ATPase [Sphingobacterium sp. KU25419]